MRYKFGAAYESYDIKKGKIFLLDILMFFLRRALLVYVVIYKMENLTLQIVVLFSTTLLQIVIIANFEFYESRSKNRAELLNEVFTMFIMYGTFLFTDYIPDAKVKYDLGYVFSAFIILHLFLNLGIIARWNFKISTRAWHVRMKLRQTQIERTEWRNKRKIPYCMHTAGRRQKWKKKFED